MKRLELTDLQTKCLACAIETSSSADTVKLVLELSEAATVDGVLAAMCVVDGLQRTLLLAAAREAITEHRPTCTRTAHECLD